MTQKRASTVFALWGAFLLLDAHAGTISATLANGIKIDATEERFVPGEHHLAGCGQAFSSCVVDGIPATGAIHMPKTRLTDIAVHIENRTFHLETTGMFDPLLGPGSGNDFGAFCYDADNCTFRAILGDAGGTYVAEWIVTNGVQRRTVLSDSSDLVNFVRRNLTPPHFD